MHFDKATYRIAKKRINGLIKDSLRGCGENPEGFIADGVICPDVYEKQRVRILCILAESYGYDKNEIMTDIEDQMKEGNDGDILGLRKRVPTPTRLAILLYLLQRSIENDAKIIPEEWKKVPRLFIRNDENTKILQDALSKVAWINVKKASRGNGTKLDSAECRNHARLNQEILRQQIEVIAPNLIIVCSEDAFRALHEMGLLGSHTMLARKWKIQGDGSDPHIIEITHPSYRQWASYDGIYENYNVIYDQWLTRIGNNI